MFTLGNLCDKLEKGFELRQQIIAFFQLVQERDSVLAQDADLVEQTN